MSAHAVAILLIFALSMSITPGAGNIALLSISNRYGFSAALPFVAGTVFGVLVVFVGISAGVSKAFQLYPEIYSVLKFLGAGYLLYLAWGIANTDLKSDHTGASNIGFSAGAVVQVLNPKAWITALMAFSQFTDLSKGYLEQALTIILVFTVAMVFSNLCWVYFGAVLKRLLSTPKQALMLNRCLGLLLAATVALMIGAPV